MGLDIKVVAFGFGSLALALGVGLLALAYNYTKEPGAISGETYAGWFLIIGAFVIWAIGFIAGFAKKGKGGHRWHT